ncbi:MAG: hypothetical protein JOZ49_12510 [Mycolicibacterium sp.]|nr:hypothetical protein [Mycolicibacterium sp.]
MKSFWAAASAILESHDLPRYGRFMISSALRILRLTAMRLWLLNPGTPLWRLPLP